MLHSLIRELILYKFKMGHHTTKETKIIFCVKGENTVDCRTVIRWFKKYRLGCKNLSNQVRSGRPKTVDSAAVLQVIKVSQMSSTWRVSGEFTKNLCD